MGRERGEGRDGKGEMGRERWEGRDGKGWMGRERWEGREGKGEREVRMGERFTKLRRWRKQEKKKVILHFQEHPPSLPLSLNRGEWRRKGESVTKMGILW